MASAWTQYTASREGVDANRELVSAQQLALDGVIEERNVGQRTTLDVLNAQQDVINAQINLISSQRDVVVASYAILSAVGRLTVDQVGLQRAAVGALDRDQQGRDHDARLLREPPRHAPSVAKSRSKVLPLRGHLDVDTSRTVVIQEST